MARPDRLLGDCGAGGLMCMGPYEGMPAPLAPRRTTLPAGQRYRRRQSGRAGPIVSAMSVNIARIGVGLAAVLLTVPSWAQQAPKPGVEERPVQRVPSTETPVRQPLSTQDEDGKSVPAKQEKLVLADPDSKLYMPCRDPNDKSTEDSANRPKLNPKAAVLSEEAAKQHGYKASAHAVDCPKK